MGRENMDALTDRQAACLVIDQLSRRGAACAYRAGRHNLRRPNRFSVA